MRAPTGKPGVTPIHFNVAVSHRAYGPYGQMLPGPQSEMAKTSPAILPLLRSRRRGPLLRVGLEIAARQEPTEATVGIWIRAAGDVPLGVKTVVLPSA